MNIDSAKYVALNEENHSVKIISGNETIYVPIDPANRHYAEILRQVEAGELTIADAD